MEVLRRAEPEVWGVAPFTIGLWVGQRVTPNTTDESHAAIEKERDGKSGTGSTPAQLTSCPWCGSEIAPGREIRVDRDLGRTFVYCGDKYGRCEFSQAKSKNLGLPVLVVDDEIYRHPPSMLIATVDKFAMMAWRGQVRALFGKANRECPRHGLLWPEADCNGNHTKKGSLEAVKVKEITPIRPPDLIIQDEFHLISGPLGTMVGLYETAVDELSTWTVDGKAIRPKIVASTATVRKAEEQVNNVFLRRVSVFPPHGLDVEDNFFSVQRSVEDKPGRLYMGICSPGSSRPAVLIRVYVALLTAAQSLFQRFGAAADPYMTVVGYFNSLRELGGMRRLAEDDVQTRAYRVQMSDVKRPGLSQRSVRIVDELTSRVSNKEIPKKLDQLEVKFKPTWEKGETRAIDIVLGHQHAVGGCRRQSYRTDGRQRATEEHGGIHSGHEPRRPFLPWTRLYGAHLVATSRSVPLRNVRALSRDVLQACRGPVGHAVRGESAGPWPDRCDGESSPARKRFHEPESRGAIPRQFRQGGSPESTEGAVRACLEGEGQGGENHRRYHDRRSDRPVGEGSGESRAQTGLRDGAWARRPRRPPEKTRSVGVGRIHGPHVDARSGTRSSTDHGCLEALYRTSVLETEGQESERR